MKTVVLVWDMHSDDLYGVFANKEIAEEAIIEEYDGDEDADYSDDYELEIVEVEGWDD